MPISSLTRKILSTTKLADNIRIALDSLPFHTKDFDAGDVLVREGDKPHSAIVVLSGCLFRYKIVGDGKRQIMSFHLAGDMPDLQSMFLRTMDHNLSCVGPAQVALVSHDALRELTAAHPDTMQCLWRETLIDSAIFREWIANTGRRRAVPRTAHLLCELMVRANAIGLVSDGVLSLPLTQNHFADALGLSLVHINRSLQELRREKLVEVGQGHFRILDWPKLKEIGDFDDGYLNLRTDG